MTAMEWTYAGRTFPFDISSAESVSRLTEAIGLLTEDGAGEDAPLDVQISRHCHMIAAFFDFLFGEGTAAEICGTEESARAYSAAYLDFIACVRAQIAALGTMQEEAEARYLARGDEIAGVM